jgi:ribonuclease P protein component
MRQEHLYNFSSGSIRSFLFSTYFFDVAKQFTLGKTERLKSRKLIDQLFKEGKTFNVFPFRIHFLMGGSSTSTAANPNSKTPMGHLKMGAGAAIRNFVKATDRNRIKRITKESWRLQKNNLQQKLAKNKISLNVFLIYTAKDLPDYETVYNKVRIILDKLIKQTDENISKVS